MKGDSQDRYWDYDRRKLGPEAPKQLQTPLQDKSFNWKQEAEDELYLQTSTLVFVSSHLSQLNWGQGASSQGASIHLDRGISSSVHAGFSLKGKQTSFEKKTDSITSMQKH